jgi:hypothetical protein
MSTWRQSLILGGAGFRKEASPSEAQSTNKVQLWPIQKKYVKTIGQFSESVEHVVDPILQ